MGFFSNLFGGGKDNVQEYLEKGAAIIDVRTPGEFKSGHIKGAVNIPLQTIESSISKIKKMNKAVVFCCASGMRSGQATSIAKRNGIDCVNGGPWTKVDRKAAAV